MDTNRIIAILEDVTAQLRKGGEEAGDNSSGDTEVANPFFLPLESGFQAVKIDCHYIVVAVSPSAEKYKTELRQILKEWPSEIWGKPVPRLQDRPTYIQVASIVGGRGVALQLFALGHALGLWQIVTPKKFGVTGKTADGLAKSGLIVIDNFRPG